MLRLIYPTKKFQNEYIRGAKEILTESNCTSLRMYEIEQFDSYISDCRIARNSNTNGPLRTEYWLMNSNKYIGKIQIRHKATGKYNKIRSHIYYEIIPSKRGKGNGSRILQLGRKKAKTIGLNKILVTCHNTNIASKAIIEKNGGVLLKSEITPEGVILQYSIRC